MAARLHHPSATPTTLDLSLREMSEEPIIPTQEHQTDYGTVLRYVLGVRYRKASLKFVLTTPAQYDQFLTFYRTVTNANTRFTFIADATNFASDTWSAFFVGKPSFEREHVPGARMLWHVSVDIVDAPVSL